MPTPSGIGYNLAKHRAMPFGVSEVEGYKETFTADGEQQAIRVFDVNWYTRKAFVDWVLGYTESLPDSSIYRLSRTIPAQHPEYPWMYASSIELVSGIGKHRENPHIVVRDGNNNIVTDVWLGQVNDRIPVSMIAYDDSEGLAGLARYSVVYRPRDYTILTDDDMTASGWAGNELSRYVSRTVTYAITTLPIPANTLQFTEGPYNTRRIPEAGVRLFPTKELTYTWHQVPDVPDGAISDAQGLVNDGNFDGLGGAPTYPAETLLFQPPAVVRGRMVNGRVSWTIAYKFLYRPTGWNKFPAPDGNDYRVGKIDALVRGPYLVADFNLLFRPPTPKVYL